MALSAAFWLVACAPDEDGDLSRGDDCNDKNAAIFPGAVEVCDGIDNNCDGYIDEDVAIVAYWDRDRDGFGDAEKSRRVCELPADGALEAGDCDDTDPSAHPGAPEQCDGQDDNCDGTIDEDAAITFWPDADGDGHGVDGASVSGCEPPEGYAVAKDDCDDTEPLAWTGAPELCDGADNDCDGNEDEDLPPVRLYVDADGDGFGAPGTFAVGCGPGPGTSDNALDCDDSSAFIHPDADELVGNALDEDCDGYINEISVPGDFATLADAIAAAQTGDVVQLDAGTFVDHVDLTGKDITLAGEGCDRTLLYADGAARAVTMDRGALQGLTIGGGSAESGGGLQTDGTVLVDRVCFANNAATAEHGGAIFVRSGQTTVVDSRFTRNSAALDGGAIAVEVGATLHLTRARFEENKGSDGGAITGHGGNLVISNAEFLANAAADDGGAIALKDFTDPVSGDVTQTDLLITNSTFHANVAADYAEAIYATNSVGVGRNLLMTGHDDPGTLTARLGGSTLDIATSGSSGNAGWENGKGPQLDMLRGNPRYVWTQGPVETWDLRLLPGSAAIDVGDAEDLDPDGTRADLGAFGGPDADPASSDAYRADFDEDGLFDGWEIHAGRVPFIADADVDQDGDGLDALAEQTADTDANVSDTDGDGISDGIELSGAANPLDPRDHRPVVALVGDRWAPVGGIVELDVTATHDPNQDTLTYAWSIVPPFGSVVVAPQDPTDPLTSFVPDVPGQYDVTLVVSDGGPPVTATLRVHAREGIFVPQDAADLASALEDVDSGDAIFVGPGTWAANLDLAGKDVAIVGMGDSADDVVLDGGLLGRVIVGDSGERLALAHLTVTGGTGPSGGAVYLAASGAPGDFKAADVVFVGNSATTQGGAVAVSGSPSEILDSRFEANTAATNGGGLWLFESETVLRRSVFSDNVAGTKGGGLYAATDTNAAVVRLDNNVFQVNLADAGSALAVYGALLDLQAYHNAWLEHDSSFGTDAVVSLELSNGFLIDNVVAWNETNRGISGLSAADLFTLYHLFWENTGIRFTYAVDDGGAAAGHIDADPQLIRWSQNGVADDLIAPRPGSPLIDAGYPEFIDPDGTRSDIGPSGGQHASPRQAMYVLDGDLDGISDGWEIDAGLDPWTNDASLDADSDGLTNQGEYLAGSDPHVADSDGDGVNDGAEVLADSDPNDGSDNLPTADAGDDLLVEVGEAASLDATDSDDPNNDPLSYAWSVISAPAGSTVTTASLVPNNGAFPSFTPDVRGDYLIRLTVSDGKATSTDEVTVSGWGTLEVPGDYPTLAAALADVGAGDVVALAAGTWSGTIPALDVPWTLQGAGRELTEIIGQGTGSVLEADQDLTVRDLSIRGGVTSDGGGISCLTATLTLERVRIHHNAAERGGALSLRSCSTSLTDVDLDGNFATSAGGAIWTESGDLSWTRGRAVDNRSDDRGGAVWTSTDAEIWNVVFARNRSTDQGSAVFQDDLNLRLRHTVFLENQGPSGAVHLGDGDVLIANSAFIRNQGYGFFRSTAVPDADFNAAHNAFFQNSVGSTNLLKDSLGGVFGFVGFLDGANLDLRLDARSPWIDNDSGEQDPDGTASDIGAFGGPRAGEGWDEGLIDTDNDGMPDRWELLYGLDPDVADGGADPDDDGLSARDEHDAIARPDRADSDLDGVDDLAEWTGAGDPAFPGDHAPELIVPGSALGAVGSPVTVTASTGDPEGTDVGVSWTIVAAPGRSSLEDADLTDADTAVVSFTPDSPGAYRLRATATDEDGGVTTAEVTIRAAGTLLVPEDYDSVAEAIDAAVGGEEIVVGPGIWSVQADLAGKSLTFTGAGSDDTLLTALDAGPVLTARGAEDVTLVGITLTRGISGEGGGFAVVGGSLDLEDVAFVANKAIFGGGLFAGPGSTATGSGLRFVDNVVGADGGAMALMSSEATFEGLFAGGSEAAADGGFAYLYSADLALTNAVITDHAAGQGGAFYLSGSSGDRSTLDLAFTTLTANQSPGAGSAIRASNADVMLSHSLIAYHSDSVALSSNTFGSPTWTLAWTQWGANTAGDFDLLIAPVSGQDGNLAVTDPGFTAWTDDDDWENDDWSLTSGSPAQDAGDPAVQDPDGSTADVGAYGGPGGDWP